MPRFLLIFFCLFLSLAHAKLPDLTPQDVQKKTQEVLKAHACHKKITPELVERILANYLEELDPMKTYFLKGEIAEWTHPSPALVAQLLAGFETGDFSPFQEVLKRMQGAILRRGALEVSLLERPLPADVKSEEFKDVDWASSEEELLERLLRIKSLQTRVAERLGKDSQEKLLQTMQKKRQLREAELLHKEEAPKHALTHLLKATTSALDAHTNYFTPSEANQFMIQVQQRLFGIGAQLRDDLDGLCVVRILENSPASLSSKLKIQDKIIAVDQEPIVGMEISEAVELIRGEKGTPVLLTVLRETEEEGLRSTEKLEIELVRGEVVLEDTRLEVEKEPFGDGYIALLRLFSFYQDQKSSSAGDIRKALEELQKDHLLKGVVLDLRSNAGGLLTQAVAVTGLFIDNGIVVSIKDHTGKVQHLRETEGRPLWKGPLVLLVNRASASAAEIVAQTLQDYGRGLVVGDDHTFGKGSFQTFTLDTLHQPKINPQGEYKVTRGKYYTVSGKSPQLYGVSADLVVPGILSELEVGERFAKFPLENDAIEPHFQDDLSDLSPFHRLQLGSRYRQSIQQKSTLYESLKPILQENSEQRIAANKNYQNFLEEIRKKNFDADPIALFGQTDLQQAEAVNILKDLIFLLETQKAASGVDS